MDGDAPHRTPETRDLSRRKMLGLVGSAGLAALFGPEALGFSRVRQAASLSCVVRPEQTEGPYFVDEMLDRADIRRDPTDGAVAEGLPLRLKLTVHRVDGDSCTRVPGAKVDLWQCDALGVYSDVRDINGLFDTRGKKFLRGYQMTHENGGVEFLTVYPGWYAGRTPHIHFKIRVPAESARAYEFISQLYFDDSVSDLVYALPPYNAKGAGRTRNEGDGIFRRGGNQLMLNVAKDGAGYIGTFDIGLRMS